MRIRSFSDAATFFLSWLFIVIVYNYLLTRLSESCYKDCFPSAPVYLNLATQATIVYLGYSYQ